MENLGNFTLKCPRCAGTKFLAESGGEQAPNAPITCGDCGYVSTPEALVQHNQEALAEEAEKRLAGIVEKTFRKITKH
jgi:ribosomal protein S27AE